MTPALRIHVLRRRLHAFQVCGGAGALLGTALALALVDARGGRLAVMGAIAVAAVLAFLVLAAATVVLDGEERLVYFHHEIAILCLAAAVPALLGEPVLLYLDATAIGLGVVLACGRVGCFMVGCCHGRPHAHGVRYGEDHGNAGLDREFVGVPLLPVQLVEAGWVLGVSAAGAVLVAGEHAVGAAFALYVTLQSAGRFALEYLRGDAARPYYGAFSQPQWIAATGAWLVVVGGALELFPAPVWHTAVAVAIAVAMAVTLARRPRDRALRSAAHRAELLAALGNVFDDHESVATTSLGVRLSGGSAGDVTHLTLSGDGLNARLAGALAFPLLIAAGAAGGRVSAGSTGVFHVVGRRPTRPATRRPATRPCSSTGPRSSN